MCNVGQSSCSKSLSKLPVYSQFSISCYQRVIVHVWGWICLDLMWFVLLFEFRFQTSHTALRQMLFFSPAEPQPSDKLTSNQSPIQLPSSTTALLQRHTPPDRSVCVCLCKYVHSKPSLNLIFSQENSFWAQRKLRICKCIRYQINLTLNQIKVWSKHLCCG